MLSTRLKGLRATKQISQADLSNILGVTQQAVGKWERDKTTPDYETLKKIASFFNVTTDYLLGNDTPSPSYYDDPEVAEMANRLKDDPDMKILFDASKKLSKNDLQFVIDMVNRMKRE
jgi:transcriptional regulator with XRE-family HTH domain